MKKFKDLPVENVEEFWCFLNLIDKRYKTNFIEICGAGAGTYANQTDDDKALLGYEIEVLSDCLGDYEFFSDLKNAMVESELSYEEINELLNATINL